MPLHIERAEGETQYRNATHYFTSLIKERVLEHNGELNCSQQLYNIGRPISRAVSIWQHKGDDVQLQEVHLLMVQRILKSIHRIHRCDGSPEAVEGAIRSLPHHLDSTSPHTFFIEAYQTEQRLMEADRRTGLFIGVVNNEVEFVDAEDLMFIRLEPGLFGMAVVDKGSYLVRVDDPADAAAVRQRA